MKKKILFQLKMILKDLMFQRDFINFLKELNLLFHLDNIKNKIMFKILFLKKMN